MPNIAAVFKEEVSRLARKEIRREIEGLRRASTQHRGDLAELKRQVTKLRRQVSLLERRVLTEAPSVPSGMPAERARFTAKGLRSQRKRLGLSAADYGKLVGVTGQSIYNWERGTTRPRKEQVPVLASLRGIGKKEARARLEQLAKQRTKTAKKS